MFNEEDAVSAFEYISRGNMSFGNQEDNFAENLIPEICRMVCICPRDRQSQDGVYLVVLSEQLKMKPYRKMKPYWKTPY